MPPRLRRAARRYRMLICRGSRPAATTNAQVYCLRRVAVKSYVHAPPACCSATPRP